LAQVYYFENTMKHCPDCGFRLLLNKDLYSNFLNTAIGGKKVKFKKGLKRLVLFILLLVIFMFLNNSSLLTKAREGEPILLAHRGLGQTFTMKDIKWDTCTAERIYEPEHPYLENTLPSMEAAFAAGADLVELDIKPTKDGQFAIFHDGTLDCRTNVKGSTHDYTMEELKKVDIGYGYTADNGKTYPFRGKGVGLMPSLDEVFHHFKDEPFLIHIKNSDPNEGKMLARILEKLPEKRLSQLAIYGDDVPIETLKEQIPELRILVQAGRVIFLQLVKTLNYIFLRNMHHGYGDGRINF
jgi:glycerophosphoryl diester phosphodiesterase